ncbi:MAG: 5-bromo-4-chloroindolyl phosphate hydrolysis family protein [Proteobacteria bacterium]|nr:5-bromo-4-chloroindolyl phosphate hydrolysis family protein [Pseudomonadota bacterium]MBU1738044.1 5-bromo-4-chloroindolyl phosphate hydrolysis family protein [Pseudomonadota bacterium]
MAKEDIVQEGKKLLARERAKTLIAEAEVLSEQDLRGALGMFREALKISPDYPDLEDEIFLREDAIEKLDGVLQHIVAQLKGGKNYRAFQLLQELPDNYIILDKSGTVDQLAEKVRKVESLIEGAKNLPRSGNSQALPMLEEAFTLMPDYPGLQADIDALAASRQNYNDYIAGVEASVAAGDTVKARSFLDQFKGVYPEDASVGRLEFMIQNKEKEKTRKAAVRKNLFMAAAAGAGFLGLIIVYFAFELMTFKSANGKWQEAAAFLEAEKFADARTAAEEVKASLGKVSFSSQSGKKELLVKVEELLNSERVIQGVQGKILVDGKYIQKESLAGAQESEKIIKEAEGLMAAGDYSSALARFADARNVASLLDAALAAKINEEIEASAVKCQTAHVKSVLRKANSLHGAGNYEEATALFAEARNLAKGYGFKRNDAISRDIETAAGRTIGDRLDILIADGDALLNAAAYDDAIDGYKKALDFARLNKLDSNDTVNRLYGSINRARIFGLLAKGDENFKLSRWVDSIKFYNNAVELSVKAGLRNLPVLEQAVKNAKLAETRISLDELKRLELTGAKQFAESSWQEAHDTYKNLVAMAGNTAFAGSPEFAAILVNSREKLAITGERIFIKSKKDYLEEKYRSILKNAFGTGADITFLNPEVILLSEDEKLLKFSISAKSYVKKGGGQGVYSNYEVQYAYDRQKDSWHLLDKSSNSQSAGE